MDGRIIQGLDIIDVVKHIDKGNRRYIAIMLDQLEQILDPSSEEFKFVRKLILDSWNSYTRSVMKIIFGDIEFGSSRYK